ncbi:probable pectinesterase 55 [Trifolium pratense]|uniref:probable pectinesterase 55 n=1 Tax=Trifolium pratense TaxID=57577 RepID=UPI001E691434|nr:probable pectinesterase 55 [Trifolium pratense]
MFRLFLFAFIIPFVVLRVDEANAQLYKTFGRQILPYSTIYVDPSGQDGSFLTIQSAIDSIPSHNDRWIAIRVKAGIYREKIGIPREKPFIILKGAGKRKTFVEWNDHSSTDQSPTFTSLANNTVVRTISFRNTYNEDSNGVHVAAVAAMISGDQSYFYRVGFYGYQDTLWDDRGRHYYKLCTIQGAIDFIFGDGQSLFERCAISVIGGGFITAQGRDDANDPGGFVFKDCAVFGNATTYLGRPWRKYARVLFYNSNLTNIVEPSGWNTWNSEGNEGLTTFAEYGNFGPGADTSQRVSWAKSLDLATIEQMTSMNFVNKPEQWIGYQPY